MFRSNLDALLDCLTDSENRMIVANEIRNFATAHETGVKDFILRTVDVTFGEYLSNLFVEQIDLIAAQITQIISQTQISKLQVVLDAQQVHHKTESQAKQTQAEKTEIAVKSNKKDLNPGLNRPMKSLIHPGTDGSSSTDTLSPIVDIRASFVPDHDDDVVRSERPVDFNKRPIDSITKSQKSLVHLTKDRPKIQVFYLIFFPSSCFYFFFPRLFKDR
jgi:hypothetical protein